MKGWHLGVALLAVIGVAVMIGVPYGRAVKFQFACQETVDKLGRFPTAQELLALKPAIEGKAPAFQVDASKLDVKVGLRSVDGGGARLFYARAEVRHDGRYHAHELLIDSGKVTHAFLEALKDGGGVAISGTGVSFADAPPPDDEDE